jgi:hypothetical protein
MQRILPALAVLVSFSKLASADWHKKFENKNFCKQISGKHMPLSSWQHQPVAISSELSKIRTTSQLFLASLRGTHFDFLNQYFKVSKNPKNECNQICKLQACIFVV